jgi:hypothetical protein
MTTKQKKEFNALPTEAERAAWLLNHPVTASIQICPETMGLVAMAQCCGVYLPGKHETEEIAITEATKWLKAKAASGTTDI